MISFALFFENYNQKFVMTPSAALGLNNTLNIPKVESGFWVNKWGHWIAVPWEGHSTAALKIIQKYRELTGENILVDGLPYKTLYSNGYVRLVVEHDLIHWEHPSKSYVPTQSQQKFFKELEMTYHLPVVKDKAASVIP